MNANLFRNLYNNEEYVSFQARVIPDLFLKGAVFPDQAVIYSFPLKFRTDFFNKSFGSSETYNILSSAPMRLHELVAYLNAFASDRAPDRASIILRCPFKISLAVSNSPDSADVKEEVPAQACIDGLYRP